MLKSPQRLEAIYAKFGIGPEELSRRVKCDPSTLTKIKKGEREIGRGLAESIAREFKISLIWAKDGTGEMFAAKDQEGDNVKETIEKLRSQMLDLSNQINSRLNAIDQRLSALEQRLNPRHGTADKKASEPGA